MKRQKTKLFRKWLFTYLFLSIVALIFIFSIHTIYNQNMKEDLTKLNNLYLNQMVEVFDEQFRGIDQLMYTIALDEELINILAIEGKITIDDRYNIWEMTQKLDLFARSNSLAEKIAIYKKNPKIIVGESVAYYEPFIDVYTNFAFGFNSAIFEELMEKKYSQDVIRLNDWYSINKKSNPLIYLQTLPIQFQNHQRGTLLIRIDEKKLAKLGESELFPNSKLLVFNQSQQLIYTNDEDYYSKNLETDELTNIDHTDIEIDEIFFNKQVIYSDYKNWIYVSLVPKEIYFSRINEVRTLILLMSILFFGVNIIIAYYFSNVMYMPVNKIISKLGNQDRSTSQSEYEFIESVVTKNAIEKEKMIHNLYLQRQPLTNAFYSKLLRGGIKDSEQIQKKFLEYKIPVTESGYQILLVEFISSDDEFSNITLCQFILHNIFEEILQEHYTCSIVEVEARVAIIINLKEDSIRIKELEEYLDNALKMIENRFGLECLIGISNSHKDLLNYPVAYQECVESIVQTGMLEDIRIIYTADLDGYSTQYEFSTEEETRLTNFIMSGNYESCKEVIDGVINHNIKNKPLKAAYLQCLMFDIMGGIIKSNNDSLFNEMMEETDAIYRMKKVTNIEEMRNILSEVAKIACDINASYQSQNSRNLVKDDIDQYIQDHYNEVELNVSKLGEAFNITPTYLSKLYKKETGNSILYAINTVRIDASKNLLIESKLTINEISKEVGYLYSNAFIRFFKKQTGVTPGQYKTLNKNI